MDIELSKQECSIVANALMFYVERDRKKIRTGKLENGKALTKEQRAAIARVLPKHETLYRFFLVASKG